MKSVDFIHFLRVFETKCENFIQWNIKGLFLFGESYYFILRMSSMHACLKLLCLNNLNAEKTNWSCEEKMITNKIKTWHWFLFFLLTVALVLFPIALALSRGEQYNVDTEEFQSVFCLSIYASMILLVVSLIIGIVCFRRGRKRWWQKTTKAKAEPKELIRI